MNGREYLTETTDAFLELDESVTGQQNEETPRGYTPCAIFPLDTHPHRLGLGLIGIELTPRVITSGVRVQGATAQGARWSFNLQLYQHHENCNGFKVTQYTA